MASAGPYVDYLRLTPDR